MSTTPDQTLRKIQDGSPTGCWRSHQRYITSMFALRGSSVSRSPLPGACWQHQPAPGAGTEWSRRCDAPRGARSGNRRRLLEAGPARLPPKENPTSPAGRWGDTHESWHGLRPRAQPPLSFSREPAPQRSGFVWKLMSSNDPAQGVSTLIAGTIPGASRSIRPQVLTGKLPVST